MGVVEAAITPICGQVLGSFYAHSIQKEDERGRGGEGVQEGRQENVGRRGVGGGGGEAEGGSRGCDQDLWAGSEEGVMTRDGEVVITMIVMMSEMDMN